MKVWALLLPAFVAALYKDQAGKYDWSIYNIGKVDFLAPASPENYFVSSERGVLAVLRSSGHIAWRRLPFGLDHKFGTVADEGLALTWSNKVVKQWRHFDGLMLWEKEFDSEVTGVKLFKYQALKAAAVLFKSKVVIIDLATGDGFDTFEVSGEVKGIIENGQELGIVYEGKGIKIRWIGEGKTSDVLLTEAKGQLVISLNTAAVVGDSKVVWQHRGKVYSQAWNYGVRSR